MCPFLVGLSTLAALPDPAEAQSFYPKHNFNFGAGAARPRGALGGPFTDAPGISIGYGYRFARYFQADIGLDVLFGAGDVRDYLNTALGQVRIRDREYLLPVGGRAILPFAGGRVLLSGGGGGAYMRYSESVRQPSDYFRIDCPVCTARHGWGYYALVSTSFAIDHFQRFRVGITSKFYRGHTEGDPLGPVPGVRTKDHWINIFGEFGFSF